MWYVSFMFEQMHRDIFKFMMVNTLQLKQSSTKMKLELISTMKNYPQKKLHMQHKR